jgi:hypothetical protein
VAVCEKVQTFIDTRLAIVLGRALSDKISRRLHAAMQL